MPENRWRVLLLLSVLAVLVAAPNASATYITPESAWGGDIISLPAESTPSTEAEAPKRSQGKSYEDGRCHDRRSARSYAGSSTCRSNLREASSALSDGLGLGDFGGWPAAAFPQWFATAPDGLVAASGGTYSVDLDGFDWSGASGSGISSAVGARGNAKLRQPLLAVDRSGPDDAVGSLRSVTVASLLHAVTLSYMANGTPAAFNGHSHTPENNGRGGPNGNGNPHTVPEPSSLLLVAVAFLIVLASRKRLVRTC